MGSTEDAGSSGTTDEESVLSGELVRETQVMRQEDPGRGDSISPRDLFKIIAFEPVAASDGLGWAGLEAIHFWSAPTSECNSPALTYHRLVLFARPPEALDLRFIEEALKAHPEKSNRKIAETTG
jgi:hypothetical protein